jgi:DNA segregation ATPase FtsK/SpoIIIE-like protein
MSLLSELPPVTAVLGLAEDGRPVLLDFTEQDMTHILISGISGAGKSALLRSLVMSLALMNRQSRVQFVVFDGKSMDPVAGTNLYSLNYLPHMLTDVMCDQDDIRNTLAFLTDEINYRLEYDVVAPTIVVIIDEVDMLVERRDPLMRDAVMSLVQRGSDVGVHLVMSTQRPQTAVLDNLFKANISVQLVGRLADSEQARMVTGLQRSQAEYLLGQGDFLAIAGQYTTHFQAAYIGDYDLHLTLQELHRKRAPTLLAQSVDERYSLSLANPELEVVDELPQHFLYTGDTIAFTYEDISPSSMVVEVEAPAIEEDLLVEEIYIPQPVIRLIHEAAAPEVEEMEVIDDQILGSQFEAEVIVEAITDDTEVVESESQSEAEERVEAITDDTEAVEEDEADSLAEEDEPDDMDEGEELGTEYVQFEDDWLPFDDD